MKLAGRARAIFGNKSAAAGDITSTLLSLVYVPVFFTFMDDLQRFAGRLRGRLLVRNEASGATGMVDAPSP